MYPNFAPCCALFTDSTSWRSIGSTFTAQDVRHIYAYCIRGANSSTAYCVTSSRISSFSTTMVVTTGAKSEGTIQENEALPPTYSETVASDSYADPELPSFAAGSSASPTLTGERRAPLLPTCNFVTIERGNHSIKGNYSINTSLPTPPGVGPSSGRDGKPLNLCLKTTNGSINSAIHLIRGTSAKEPARLQAQSTNGSITLTIVRIVSLYSLFTYSNFYLQHDSHLTRFRLRAASTNGAIAVYIPRGFIGPVCTRTRNGSTKFSPGIQQHLQTFSEVGADKSFFIGDYIAAGYQDDEIWNLDHISVETTNGSIQIFHADEEPQTGGGFFSWLLGQ